MLLKLWGRTGRSHKTCLTPTLETSESSAGRIQVAMELGGAGAEAVGEKGQSALTVPQSHSPCCLAA